MENFKLFKRIKEIYANGGNIVQYLKNIDNREVSSIEDILISYDCQAGTYIKDYARNQELKQNYCNELAIIFDKFSNINEIIEVGVGECTTLGPLIKLLRNKPKKIFGFDISWSRLKYAKSFLNDLDIPNVELFTANLFEIPLLDNSIDIVYTSHSIEPNGGKEEEALKELYRITKKYLILLEPAFELANMEARYRMKHHGYVTNLYATAKRLNYKIIEHRLFKHSSNPLNPTGLIIIEKNSSISNNYDLVCPISLTELMKYNPSFLYSEASCLAYPILDETPCLLRDNSILASHLISD